jgi:DMSO/TMAO reductase YedYZ molybdopterin-dependent catalytic subunit
MPMGYLNSWITPVPHFFVRNHMHEPSTLDAAEWRLSIAGEVEKPLTLSLAELQKLASHSVTNTVECAGNGRAFQQPKVPGVQWQRGAVGTGRFSGPRLRDLLQRAGVKSTGKHVMFHGLDEVPGKVPPFIRSIPIEKAMDADTLIATQMNPAYRLPNQPIKPGEAVKPEDTHPATVLGVKSIIASPGDDARIKAGSIPIHGAAWAGEADITKVEVSTDSGATWNPARLGTEHARYAWRLWSYAWRPVKPGDYVIMSRASDSQGRTQADTAAWNPSGYLYNAVDQVKIHVA